MRRRSRLLDRGAARQYQPRVAADGLGEPAVQLAALAGQQLVVHRLTDQAVPEHVAVGVGQQHIGGHRQQITGRPVRPVRVLDDQDDRAALGQLLEQDEHLLEQARSRLARVVRTGRLAELGQQPGQLPGRAARQQLGNAVGAQVADQLAQHRGEGGERQAVCAEFQAATGQHPGAGAAGPLGELAHQPGLADARLAADEDRGRAAVARLRQGGVQRGQLVGPADQDRADNIRRHTVKDAS